MNDNVVFFFSTNYKSVVQFILLCFVALSVRLYRLFFLTIGLGCFLLVLTSIKKDLWHLVRHFFDYLCAFSLNFILTNPSTVYSMLIFNDITKTNLHLVKDGAQVRVFVTHLVHIQGKKGVKMFLSTCRVDIKVRSVDCNFDMILITTCVEYTSFELSFI